MDSRKSYWSVTVQPCHLLCELMWLLGHKTEKAVPSIQLDWRYRLHMSFSSLAQEPGAARAGS